VAPVVSICSDDSEGESLVESLARVDPPSDYPVQKRVHASEVVFAMIGLKVVGKLAKSQSEREGLDTQLSKLWAHLRLVVNDPPNEVSEKIEAEEGP